MNLRLLAVGRGMPAGVRLLVADYTERLRRYGGCTLIEVAEAPRRPRATEAGRQAALAEEGERIRRWWPEGGMVIALDRSGRMVTSEELAVEVDRWRQSGEREVSLLIGGPDGLHPEVLKRARWSWSCGPMTFPHALMRVVVLEQLYRAMTIVHGEPYHR